MRAFPHSQVHIAATKEQAGVKKAARSSALMRYLCKNDALTLFNYASSISMDSPFHIKGDTTMKGGVYSQVDSTMGDSTMGDSTMKYIAYSTIGDSTTGDIVYSPSGQNPYTEAMDKTLKGLPTLSLCSKPNHATSDGKASRWVEVVASSAHPLSLLVHVQACNSLC